ncbi:MAG TPA: carbamate kinase [Aggregatilineales bacterium]|nr:carbamate kinase [Aggregatilineales bacterium]
MPMKTAVVAIGGNSLIPDNSRREMKYQWDAVRETSEHLARMIRDGWRVVITHGNGPQVGYILRRAELAAHEVHMVPLDIIGADTQGSIGYMVQQALRNSLRELGVSRTVISLVSQTVVAKDDPAFAKPDKPIGGFLTEAEARQFEADGWTVIEDAGRGWRRVVASPQPKEIVELDAIRLALQNDYVVIAVGGGGIPVVRNEQGELRGVFAVIDKDRASSLLATGIGADLFVISTGVEKVALNYRQPNERAIDVMTLREAREYMQQGQFAKGSMLPKIEAVVHFLEHGGPAALITDPQNIERALQGQTGTRIVPG